MIELKLPKEIARPFNLIVRRMAKVKTADNRANRDVWYGAAKRLNGVDDTGVTATGHKNAVLRQQRLLFKNVIALGAGLIAIERLAVVFAGRSLNSSGQIDALRNLAKLPTDTDVCRRQHDLGVRRHGERMDRSVRMFAEARHVEVTANMDRTFRRKATQSARVVVV